MGGRQGRAGWFVGHKWSSISLALSVGVYISIWLTVNHLYDLGVWNRHSALAYRLASAQGGAAILSILLAIQAIRREPNSKLGFIALGCGILLLASAAV
jgi:hypothetical protein